jgi:hypothetical protein
METINGLLRELNNKVPASIVKRLDGLSTLNQKLALAKTENAESPTEESQDKLDEIINFIEDTQDDLIEDLEELLDKRRRAESEARKQEESSRLKREQDLRERREQELKLKREEEEKRKLELESQQSSTPKDDETEKGKKSGGIGWGSLILGGTLLVLSAGAINYFGKRK